MPPHAPTVSVVIVCRDEPFLAATLRALRDQRRQLEAECIVVDASKGRLQHVADEHPWVTWVDYRATTAGRTISHQRNRGLTLAAAPIVAFVDAGAEPPPQWLETITAPLRHGTWRAVAGPLTPLAGQHRHTVNDHPDGAVLRVAVTANAAFMREDLIAVRGFDERLETAEDSEISARLAALGVAIHCVRDATLTMDWGTAERELRRYLVYGRGQAQLRVVWPAQGAGYRRRSTEVCAALVILIGAVVGGVLWRPAIGVIIACLEVLTVMAITHSQRALTWRPIRVRLQTLSFLFYRFQPRTRALASQPRNQIDWSRYGA